MMHEIAPQARRHFFRDCGVGLGRIALATLIGGSAANSSRGARASGAAEAPPLESLPLEGGTSGSGAHGVHFPPRARRVIYLFMAGAPSQLDLFDYKPKLVEFEGQSIPPSIIEGQRYAFIQPDAAVLSPRFKFARHGQCGAELSEMLPHTAEVVDDLAIIRSVHTDQFNHAPAQIFVNTGNAIPGHPSMGAWLSYGIGSEADDLPAFVVLESGGSLSGGAAMWSDGFLSGKHQGVPFRSSGDPILHVAHPPGYDTRAQRESLDLIGQLNRQRFAEVRDPEIETRISAYEMAFRMQMRAPELMDFSQESRSTLEAYGADPERGKASFGNNCLLARRLAERGVRFIQLYHSGWDHHSNVEGGLRKQCAETDQACAALLRDLKQRGMLEETLVVWGGEFGRTPMVEASAALGRSMGRDHHPQAFTVWMAGGGIRPGVSVGRTDDFGFHPVESPVHVHDLQATILHCLGIDHRRLSFNHRGLNVRLTGVEEHHAIEQVLA